MAALDAGLDAVKFFPAEQPAGLPMVKALVRRLPRRALRAHRRRSRTANRAAYLALPSVAAVGGTWMVAPT